MTALYFGKVSPAIFMGTEYRKISEISASGVAPIFVPYPHAAADHQRKNAKYMVEHGAGLYLENEDTTPETLKKDILQLLENKNELHQIQENATKLAKFDGAQKIVEQLK